MRPDPKAVDTFNARFLEPAKVGATFVPTPYLRDAMRSEHTAILGPRGSGKTTLLKMLTISALNSWDGAEKAGLVRDVDYVAVYVPASVMWSAEYRGFALGAPDKASTELLSISLFRHSVLIALLNTVDEVTDARHAGNGSLSRFAVRTAGSDFPAFCKDLSSAWGMDARSTTVQGVRQGVTERMRTLQRLTVEAGVVGITAPEILSRHPFVTALFWDDATALVDLLRDRFDYRHRLCLCFDELEIAPDPIALAVMRAPRSIDQRIIIKFSAAPYVSAQRDRSDPTMPMMQNDFKLLFLSSFASAGVRPFSEALFRSLSSARGLKAASIETLGLSFLDEPEDGGRYAPDGSRQRKYAALHDLDASFRTYVKAKNLDIENLAAGSEKRRAAAVRKILWPVLIREEFLFKQEVAGDQRRRLRSKHPVSNIYTGAGSIFALCEGNPRWLIGLLHPMIASLCGDQGRTTVNRSLQKELIQMMINSYFALLSTVPGGGPSGRPESLVDLVDRIGSYFQGSVLGQEFNADPVLSFVVDSAVTPVVRDLIGRGINMGAFITTQDAQSSETHVVGDIVGLKIRLANIFAPHFRLPLAGGRTINLSTILFRSKPGSSSVLLDLFGEKI